MQKISQKQQDALNKARETFLYGDRHPNMIEFRQKLKRDYAFNHGKGKWNYENLSGEGQWTDDNLSALKKRRQLPLTVNVINRTIKSFVSAEIASRKRIGYRAHIQTPENKFLAKVFTKNGLYIQEKKDVPRQSSLVLNDMAITGLGWMWVFEDPQDNTMNFERIDPWEMIPDMDDLSNDFTKMRFVCRKHWLDIETCKQTWPNFEKYYTWAPTLVEGNRSERFNDLENDYITNINAPAQGESMALICEVQTKTKKTCYKGMTKVGNPFATFSEEEADKILDKSQGIEEAPADQIMRTLFCGYTLLEHEPLSPRIPNLEDFSYIPSVYTRIHGSGLPDGMLSIMIPSQMDINARRTKAIYALNSQKTFVTGVEESENIDKIEDNATRLDSITFLPRDTTVTPISNHEMGMAQLELYNIAHAEIEKESGMHPESMGDTTGANQSGIAISRLQNASLMGQNFSFDSYTLFKKRIGRMMASILQKKDDLVVFLSDEDEETSQQGAAVVLNAQEQNINGETYIANDIRGLPFTIYVEEMPDLESSFSESKENIERLLMNPRVDILIENQPLLEALGYRNAKEIVNAAMESLQRKAMAEQAARMPQNGNMPSQEKSQMPQQM